MPDLDHFFRARFACRSGLAVVAFVLGTSVTRAADSDRWVKVAAPEFTVITTLREKEAISWAAEFAQFIVALQGFINVNPQRLPRLTIVVLAGEREFTRFQPLRANGTPMQLGGFFSRRPSWAVAGLAGPRMSSETRTRILCEGTYWFLSGFELPNPAWLAVGLGEVFSTFTIDRKQVSWGRPLEAHVMALRLQSPMPIEQLLFLSHDQLHGEGDEASLRTRMAYAQSWAFVHYLMFGKSDVAENSLTEYVRRLRTAVHPDEAFRQAFGGTYAEVDKKLQGYLDGGRYYVTRRPVVELPALKAEPAAVADVEDALARLRMVGRRYDEARKNVERAIAAAPAAPRGYELLGELAQETGDMAAAHLAYRTAIEKESRDFRPYFEIAAAEHAAAAEGDGTLRNMTPETARGISNRYERAINLNPQHRPAYQGLAQLVERVPPGNVEDVRFLEQGLKLFPDEGMVRLGLARIAKREGNTERAHALLAEIMGATPTQPAHVIASARQLESEWMQRDVFAQVEVLVNNRKYAEALAFVDGQIAAGADFSTRQQLQAARHSLQASRQLEQARVAIAEGRWDDVREIFNAVLESNAPPNIKSQVRRQLEQMEKRGIRKQK